MISTKKSAHALLPNYQVGPFLSPIRPETQFATLMLAPSQRVLEKNVRGGGACQGPFRKEMAHSDGCSLRFFKRKKQIVKVREVWVGCGEPQEECRPGAGRGGAVTVHSLQGPEEGELRKARLFERYLPLRDRAAQASLAEREPEENVSCPPVPGAAP